MLPYPILSVSKVMSCAHLTLYVSLPAHRSSRGPCVSSGPAAGTANPHASKSTAVPMFWHTAAKSSACLTVHPCDHALKPCATFMLPNRYPDQAAAGTCRQQQRAQRAAGGCWALPCSTDALPLC
jgi:hypothetical protein